jgi:hypothetical protein
MSDWIGLGIIVLILGGGVYALMRANEPRPPLTEEEFQRRAQESRSLMGAGMSALQQMLDPATERAEAVVQDMRQGYYEGEQESGDDNDTTPDSEKNSTQTDGEEERDA